MMAKSILSTVGLGMVVPKIVKNFMNSNYFKHKVVLITGGSKGLGLTLAEHLIKENAKIAICARDEGELQSAKDHLEKNGSEVLTITCDVGDKDQVKNMIDDVIEHFGHLDILINNAGIIQVGPMESFDFDDYKKAMDVMYWGIANTTLNVIPHMKHRKSGHIVNITSVGGKVSVPHLLPYDASKFAAVGFSEGSAAELRKDNIFVTTIVPSLMRTGSYVNAFFQKNNKKEFKLFSFMSSAPLLTISADKAARRILEAVKEKRVLKVVGFQARALIEMHHFFPEFTTKVFSFVSSIIPATHNQAEFEQGQDITDREENAEVSGIKKMGEKAQAQHQPPLH